ncbi:MAG TPA: metallophosphoesterase [Flavilitoribacter sp.]|nr:metallophosphoesterase [Flavilitoribacter sp.]
MTNQFYNPRNVLAAYWASAVEHYLRLENPNLTISEIRSLPMMQAVYTQLRAITSGQKLDKPPAGAPPLDNLAFLSQHFLILASAATAFHYIDEEDYDTFIAFADSYNENAQIANFSTSDLAGFALCLIIWLGMTGHLNSTEQKGLNMLLDWVEEEFGVSQTAIDTIRGYVNRIASRHFSLQYRNCSSSQYSGYGALNWTMNNDAQVIMLGDWGTGMDDAKAFLKAIWKKAYLDNPSKQIVFIHLGDIYYCGLPKECNEYFFKIFAAVSVELMSELPGDSGYDANHPFVNNPPIFTIPGNHEYYSDGYGYFELLDTLHMNWNGGDSSKRQLCSFFCLRTHDNRWQFLGMDTGQADHNALSDALRGLSDELGLSAYVQDYEDRKNSLPSWIPDWVTNWPDKIVQIYYNVVGPFAPTLVSSEKSWFLNRMDEFSGLTIMCSHHQLFSQEATINYASPQYLNVPLKKDFGSYFKNQIAAWYWGHEHTYAMYRDGVQGLNKGRLLGSSAYEATNEKDTPYANNYPMIPANSNMFHNSAIGKNSDGIYNHAAAIFYLDSSSHDITVKYYQFPAWSQLQSAPSNPQLTLMTSEVISHSTSDFVSLEPSWIGNDPVSSGDVTTDNSPTVAAFNNQVYMAYQDDNGTLSWCKADVSNYRPASNSDKIPWDPQEQITVKVGNLNMHFSTSHSPASLIANGIWYVFYVDSNKYISLLTCDLSSNTWTNVGEIQYSSSPIKTETAFSVCFYEGLIYVVYLDDDKNKDDSRNVKLMTYDPLQGGSGNEGLNYGKVKDTSNNTYTATSIAVAGRSDSPGGTDNYILMVLTDTSGNLKWAVSSDPTGQFTYKGKVTTHKTGSHTDDLTTSAGVSLTYFRNTIFMVRVDSNQKLKTVVYQASDQTWYGDLEVDVHANDSTKSPEVAQSSHYPSLANLQGAVFLLYRGNSSSNIYWCYC